MALEQVLSKLEEHSALWILFTNVFLVSMVLYFAIAVFLYWLLRTRLVPLDIETNMKFASYFIALLNGICMSVGFVMNLYRLKYWNDEEQIIFQDPGNVPFLYAVSMAYFIADFVFRMYFIIQYDAKVIQRRWDMIAHHLFTFCVYPIVNFPAPIYFHGCYAVGLGAEVSSLFLTLQWFIKYYKLSTKTQYLVKVLFIILWFTARLPASAIPLIMVIKHWEGAWDRVPVPLSLISCLIVLNLLMNLAWSVGIAKKVYVLILQLLGKTPKAQAPTIGQAHAVSLDLNADDWDECRALTDNNALSDISE
eukprot:99541_1